VGGPTTPFVLVVASGADIPNSTGASLVSNPRPRLRLCCGPRRLSPATLFEADPSRRPHLLVPGQQRDPSRGCACFGHSVVSKKTLRNFNRAPYPSPSAQSCKWFQAGSNFSLQWITPTPRWMLFGIRVHKAVPDKCYTQRPILQMKGLFCTVARIFN